MIKISHFKIQTCLGKLVNPRVLPFLTEEELAEFNHVGYTMSKNREQFLNNLERGTFAVIQTGFDQGDFCEEFIIVMATES